MCRFWHPTGTLYIAELRHFAVYIRTGGGISRHGRICSRLGARQLSGTYVHSELPQFSDIRGLISGSMPRYPHTLRPVAFVRDGVRMLQIVRF